MSSANVDYPKKLFYKINEVSRITGLKPYVLRYWESEFDELRPQKDTNDQRRYRRHDIDMIKDIKKLHYEERFTIAGARKKLKNIKKSRGSSSKTQARSKRLKNISAELSSIRAELEALIQNYAS